MKIIRMISHYTLRLDDDDSEKSQTGIIKVYYLLYHLVANMIRTIIISSIFIVGVW